MIWVTVNLFTSFIEAGDLEIDSGLCLSKDVDMCVHLVLLPSRKISDIGKDLVFDDTIEFPLIGSWIVGGGSPICTVGDSHEMKFS